MAEFAVVCIETGERDGVLAGVNELNPVYWVMRDAWTSYEAFQQGEYENSGRSAVHALFDLTVVGGFLKIGVKSYRTRKASAVDSSPGSEGLWVNMGGELEAKAGQVVINRRDRAQVALETIKKDTGAIVIEGTFENIPLASNSVKFLEANNLAPRTIDWMRAAPETARVLEPGGRFDISMRGGALEAAEALRAQGLEVTPDPIAPDIRITGRKPLK